MLFVDANAGEKHAHYGSVYRHQTQNFASHRKFKQFTAFPEFEVLVTPSTSANTHLEVTDRSTSKNKALQGTET